MSTVGKYKYKVLQNLMNAMKTNIGTPTCVYNHRLG